MEIASRPLFTVSVNAEPLCINAGLLHSQSNGSYTAANNDAHPGWKQFIVLLLLVILFLALGLAVLLLFGLQDYRLKLREVKAIRRQEGIIRDALQRGELKINSQQMGKHLQEDYERGQKLLSGMSLIRRENSDVPT